MPMPSDGWRQVRAELFILSKRKDLLEQVASIQYILNPDISSCEEDRKGLTTNLIMRKDELEIQLKDEHQLIQAGILRDESPLDNSDVFAKLCDGCRIGDLKMCQEAIAAGANINARDVFDYTPLILVRRFVWHALVESPSNLLLGKPLRSLRCRQAFTGVRCPM
jgi:hypothetical protein